MADLLDYALAVDPTPCSARLAANVHVRYRLVESRIDAKTRDHRVLKNRSGDADRIDLATALESLDEAGLRDLAEWVAGRVVRDDEAADRRKEGGRA